MDKPHLIILGAGPAGLGAAWRLRQEGKARVTVLEQGTGVGGNAGSFRWNDHWLDHGSHRLHPATAPRILADIRSLLGPDLLTRPRHGRIRLRGKWVHFPLHPMDLLLRLDKGFAAGVLRDRLRPAQIRGTGEESFASVLRASLGPTICDSFYFPYARKIWGADPEALSAIQARRRVAAGSFAKLLRKVLNAVPGFRPPLAGTFFYPARGFGQVSEAYAEAAVRGGAELHLGCRVTGLEVPPSEGDPWRVHAEQGSEPTVFEGDHVWSTLPIPLLARMIGAQGGHVPGAVHAAVDRIRYRSMVLVYLELDQDRFTEFDAHYFPDASVRITRLSETKNYAARTEPAGRTALCAELPTGPDEAAWSLSDGDLAALVADDLARSGIPLSRPPVAVTVRRLRQAYPIYDRGYEIPFGVVDQWVGTLPRFLTYGRQGLFAHDNTHHALAMAYAAAECFGPSGIDRDRWDTFRQEFATHVVED